MLRQPEDTCNQKLFVPLRGLVAGGKVTRGFLRPLNTSQAKFCSLASLPLMTLCLTQKQRRCRALMAACALMLGGCSASNYAKLELHQPPHALRPLSEGGATNRDGSSAERAQAPERQTYLQSVQHALDLENARFIAALRGLGVGTAEAVETLGDSGSLPAGGVDSAPEYETSSLWRERDGDAGPNRLVPLPGGYPGTGPGALRSAFAPGFGQSPEREGPSWALHGDLIGAIELNSSLRALVASIPTTAPVRSARITSGFGLRRHPISKRLGKHQGVDYVSSDRRIHAAGEGVVRFVGRKGGFGKMVVIEHGNGFETRYAHLRNFKVRKGQSVSAGEHIGTMGSTGYSTGVHLHFELRFRGRVLDAEKVFAVAGAGRLLAGLR